MQAENFTLDFEQLRSLTGDDNEFMIEILELILDQSPSVLAEMQNQLAGQEYNNLGATAHKYKSSINILGNPGLITLMQEIEQVSVKSGEKEQLNQLVSQFEEISNLLLAKIKQELLTLQAA